MRTETCEMDEQGLVLRSRQGVVRFLSGYGMIKLKNAKGGDHWR